MNLLIVDIETSPHQADVWGLHDQNVGLSQLRKASAMLCFAAKWYDTPEEEVIYDSVNQNSRKHMVKHAHSLLSDADAVIGWNSAAFDCKVMNREFLMQGLTPPPPYKHIDLLRTSRQSFKFASNKLDYVSRALGVGQKISHQGHGLWSACEHGDQEAWALMERYNREDVMLTERTYRKFLPWIKSHPNRNNYPGHPEVRACSTCGGTHLQKRGEARTVAQVYDRYQCLTCGHWNKSAFIQRNTRMDRERILRAA